MALLLLSGDDLTRGTLLPAEEALVCEEMNGDLSLTLRGKDVPALLCGQVILASCPDQSGDTAYRKKLQPFRVKRIIRKNGRMTAECPHLYFDAAEAPAAEPFTWQSEPIGQVCEQLSLLGGIRYRCEESLAVTGVYSGTAAAIAARLCREKGLQLIPDGREALLLSGASRRRGVTADARMCGGCSLEETVENGVLSARCELTDLPASLPGLRVFDTVTLHGLPGGPRVMTVNRVLWDPILERTLLAELGRADERLSPDVFRRAGVPGE